MRKLRFDDTFLLSQVIEDLDIQVDLNEFLDKARKDKKDAQYVGGQFFLLLARKWHKGKKSIPEFVSAISEKSIDEVNAMSMKEVKEVFVEIFKQDGIQDFFKSASEEQTL